MPRYLAMMLFFAVSTVLTCFTVTAADKAVDTNRDHRTQNIKEAYNVDAITFHSISETDDGVTIREATIYAGDTAYEVQIREDEKTFEPTLISFEDNEHIRELKK